MRIIDLKHANFPGYDGGRVAINVTGSQTEISLVDDFGAMAAFLEPQEVASLARRVGEFLKSQGERYRAPAFVITGNEAEFSLSYDNRGDPYVEGVTIELRGTRLSCSVFLSDREVERFEAFLREHVTS